MSEEELYPDCLTENEISYLTESEDMISHSFFVPVLFWQCLVFLW